MRDGIAIVSNEMPAIMNGGDRDLIAFTLDRSSRHYGDVTLMTDDGFGPAADYDE